MPDLHPLFVHFPIALLMLFAVLELLRFKAVSSRFDLFHTKALLVISGTLGGFIAAQFGEIAENLERNAGMRTVIEIHSTFADITTILGAIVSVIYIAAWLSRSKTNLPYHNILRRAEKIVDSWVMVPLALAIFVAISITGALGGAIVYGANSDPFVNFVYKLFFS